MDYREVIYYAQTGRQDLEYILYNTFNWTEFQTPVSY